MEQKYIFSDNPVLGMAVDRIDDLTWRTVNLIRDIPYTAVRSIVRSGRAVAGRPVEETGIIYSTYRAYDVMTRNTASGLTSHDLRRYAGILRLHEPKASAVFDYWHVMLSLWKIDKRLALVCCNHQLIHERKGLFLPSKQRMRLFSQARSANDKDLFDYGCISLEPGGLTAKELDDAK